MFFTPSPHPSSRILFIYPFRFVLHFIIRDMILSCYRLAISIFFPFSSLILHAGTYNFFFFITNADDPLMVISE